MPRCCPVMMNAIVAALEVVFMAAENAPRRFRHVLGVIWLARVYENRAGDLERREPMDMPEQR